jgi:hypothetical protein
MDILELANTFAKLADKSEEYGERLLVNRLHTLEREEKSLRATVEKLEKHRSQKEDHLYTASLGKLHRIEEDIAKCKAKLGLKKAAGEEQHWDEKTNFGGPTRYFNIRAKELLKLLSGTGPTGSMLEANKIPLLENALMGAYRDGLEKAMKQSFNPMKQMDILMPPEKTDPEDRGNVRWRPTPVPRNDK